MNDSMTDVMAVSTLVTLIHATLAIGIGFVMLRLLDKSLAFSVKEWITDAKATGHHMAIAVYLGCRILAIYILLSQLFS
jgi:hypothetical protein